MFRRTVDDDRGAIGGAVAWAGELASEAGLPADVVYAVEVGLEEALANLIVHGRADDGAKAISLGFRVEDGAAVVVIIDHCRPFDMTLAPVPAGPTPMDMVEGGQGLRLIRAFATRLGYRSDDGENRLTMVFRPAPPGAVQT